MTVHRFFVTAARGSVDLVAQELRELGARSVREGPGGVGVRGPLAFGYRVCLWSRCASRVLLPLLEFTIVDADDLYTAVHDLPWEDHLAPTTTMGVDYVGGGGPIVDGRFGAQRVKDAIVDRLRDRTGSRPSVDRREPEFRVNVYQRGRGASISIDLSGASLHRRGYRTDAGPAPLRETLAASLLRRAGWAELAAAGGGFVDPLCGSGTLAIEAAMVAADIAPGNARGFGFEHWLGHDAAAWSELRREAIDRAASASAPGPILARDHDPGAIERTGHNAARAGVLELLDVGPGAVTDAPDPPTPQGLLCCNPPHGRRLGDRAAIRRVYSELGQLARQRYTAWRCAILVGDGPEAQALGLPASASTQVDNGPLVCRLYIASGGAAAPSSTAFADRLRKNQRRLNRWVRRQGIHCYRVYDRDVPPYKFAVDRYEDWVVVQEFAPPRDVEPDKAQARRDEVFVAVADVLGVEPDRIVARWRSRQPGAQHDHEADETDARVTVREGGHRFLVNLGDDLDTGLFLDRRDVRRRLAELAPGRVFLNLYAHTGAATVYAAAGGARATTSVDLSANDLAWARRNMELNDFKGTAHRFVRADCRSWLVDERERYGLIFMGPPTVSSSRRADALDLKRDHAELIELAAERLESDGVLVFTTHARGFALDPGVEQRYVVEEITKRVTPVDFDRRPTRCWLIRAR